MSSVPLPSQSPTADGAAAAVAARTRKLCEQQWVAITQKVDRSFLALMLCQYGASLILALIFSVRGINGQHPSFMATLLFGGAITGGAVALAWRRPGQELTRHVVAAGQMMMSGLLIYITGGRIETHFHVFG